MEGVLSLKYNIGDTVIGIGKHDGLEIDGRVGKIVFIGSHISTVEFNERFDPIRLHDGNGVGRKGYCWNIPYDKLEKYEEESYTYNVDLDVFNQLIIS